ncbi:hypothetical protein HY030_00635 [Candidatus Gottesmanbacteria bacterium]|nr:hypothetical protein [Candidatus Gottesmanbacteria bacterium]
MSKNKIILSSLAIDLKRVALGLQRNSFSMAKRFEQEAYKRKSEIDTKDLAPYMQALLSRLDKSLTSSSLERKAEDALFYSTLIQNYVLYK